MKKGNNAWNKPLEIWEIMALSSASPKSYPILTSPPIMKRKREGLSLLIKLRNKMTRRVTRIFLNRPRKAVYVSEETQRKLDFVVRRIGEHGASVSGNVEQVLREHLDQYKEDVERWRKL